MNKKRLDQLILQMENHLECWKEFNLYVGLARSKSFTQEDETEFLELKSIITQELEVLFTYVEPETPTKEEVLAVISSAPSIRFMSELNESTLRTLENQWHRIFIAWQSLLGQLKVHQKELEKRSVWSSLFSR